MTIGSIPICFECKHLHPEDPDRDGFQCDAYPEGIPQEILEGLYVHNKPYSGDNGIQFEAKES